jgi:glycosyltransferase involved in cell wall biosynthesis
LTPQLSIIIPTYNRKEILLKALEGYKHQTALTEILEILVIDDGSTDGTAAAVAGFGLASPITIRCLSQQNRGSAAARNYGIREAKGTLLFFTDDDIIPGPTLIAEHIAWHRRYPDDNFAMLGQVVWSPEVHPTPFMEWMGSYGALFGYASLLPGKEVSFEYFYTCNVSAKREFLLKNGLFDETFRGSGYEDTELSYRLVKKGFCIFYNPEAIGYHYKYLSYAEACRRQEGVCASWLSFEPTEAGQYLKNRTAQAKPMTRKRRLMLAMARAIAPLLAPLTLLFDTYVRLPRIVYSLVYFFYVAPKAQARFERSRQQRQDAKAT